MKNSNKKLRTIIAILTAGFMLMAFAACDKNKEETTKEDTFMKAIFESITSSDRYKEWKQMNPESQFEEKFDGSKIIFTVKNDNKSGDFDEDDITNDNPVLSGEYVFTHEGDYVVYTSEDAGHMGNAFLMQVMIAICDYYEMSFVDANEYLADHPEKTYYLVDNEADTVRIYAAEWKIK